MFKKLVAVMAVLVGMALPAFADHPVHKIVFHVDQNDPALMNMTLNNVQNVNAYFVEQGEEVEIQVVAYGPGLHMFRADTSPVADRIATLSLELPSLTFAACGNTHRKMEAKSGNTVELLDEAEMVPSGVVQIALLQEHGWSYVRP